MKHKIAISGKMCAGKTSVTNELLRMWGCGVRVSMATRLKELAVELFGMDPIHLNKDRPLLRSIGEAMRVIDEDVWINAFMKQADKHDVVICDDARFPNEFKALQQRGFITVRLDINPTVQRDRIMKTYPKTYQHHMEGVTHYTETLLDDCDAFDITLDADSYTAIELATVITDYLYYYK